MNKNNIINCSAPGPVHESLRKTLIQYANKKNFTLDPSFELPDCQPDVFFESSQDNAVFVGDAKDSRNETVGNNQTLERIKKYIAAMKDCLIAKQCKYVRFAIATNDEKAVDEWTESLEKLFEESGFMDSNSSVVSFAKKYDNEAWITSGLFQLKED